MGVSIEYLEGLAERGIFSGPTHSIMDIGAQKLSVVTPDEVIRFVKRLAPDRPEADLALLVRNLAETSQRCLDDSALVNEAYLADLLVAAGFNYTSLDVYEHPRNLVADLNFYSVPAALMEAFNLILNCGTTAHIFNQANCFNVIHDFTSLDGLMLHQVPADNSGEGDYFVYRLPLLKDIARVNGYDVVDTWAAEPGGPGSGSVLNVLLRKTRSDRFRMPLHASSACALPASTVSVHYDTDEQIAVRGAMEKIRRRLDDQSLGWREIVELAQAHASVFNNAPMPPAIEARALRLALADFPSRDDMRKRLAELEQNAAQQVPIDVHRDIGQSLASELRENPAAASGYLIQTIPHEFEAIPEERRLFEHLWDAYHRVHGSPWDPVRILQFMNLMKIANAAPEGEYGEFGSHKGFLTRVMHRLMDPSRTLYSFDTFEGFVGEDLAVEKSIYANNWEEGNFAPTSPEEVARYVGDGEWPVNLRIVKGWFPDSFEGYEDIQWRFVHIDFDLYQPIKRALEVLWPKVVPGGVCVVHDYGCYGFPGVRKAVDGYFGPLGLSPVSLCDRWGSVAVVKPRREFAHS